MTRNALCLTAPMLLILLPFATLAQSGPTAQAQDTKGVHFEDNLSWTAIKAKAEAEHKYIFMDCFTTWCGPCKYMAKTIFPQEESGNFFNDKFISVGVQLDTSAKDNDRVRSWYADAHAIAEEYGIRAYPTYLIFSPDGKPLHRLVGSRATAKEFVNDMQSTFDTTKQYYTQLQQFHDGRHDSAFLRRLAMMSINVYDLNEGQKVADAYCSTQSDPYSPGVLDMTLQFTRSTTDKGFAVLLAHPDKVDAAMGAGMAEQRVYAILLQEYVSPAIRKAGSGTPDWRTVRKAIAAHYPAQAEEATEKSEALYYQHKGDWPHFQTAIVTYMKKYGAHATPGELNDFAWTVFQNCPDMMCVSDALDWSKRSFKDKAEPAYMDTYANILYKMGKKDDAIAWEQKALDLSDDASKPGYQSTIDKMKKGEKTWN